MKIKVGNIVYSGDDYPIMVILTEKDKEAIKSMHSETYKYTECPNGYDQQELTDWMNDLEGVQKTVKERTMILQTEDGESEVFKIRKIK